MNHPATVLAVAAALGAFGRPAEAAHDEADLLYSTQLSFTTAGDPIVTVGLMDGQRRVTVTAAGGLRVHFSGPAGAQIILPAGTALDAHVEDGRPGETHFRVVLEAVPGAGLETTRRARQRWSDRGLEVEAVELGGIVGYPDRLLDNRKVLVAEAGTYADHATAQARADALAERWELPEPPGVFAEPVRRASGTIVLTDRRSGATLRQRDTLSLTAADGGAVEVARVEYGRGYAHHGFQDRTYHGAIVLAVDPTARLAVVNRVSAEQLLRGLVPSETFPSAPAAALEAQAITARGELLAKLGVRHLADPFLVCASQHCQVYSGIVKEEATTDEAVRRTRGRMLFDDHGRLVDSVYSASCGGHTEHNENVWDSTPQATLRGRADATDRARVGWAEGAVPTDEQLRAFLADPPASFCGTASRGRKVFRWTRELSDGELDRLVNARHPIGHVLAFQVVERGVSGRVKRVRFTGVEGDVDVTAELRVRRLLGNLRSGLFVIDRTASGWRLTGGGYGHGVGMCQYGAIGMAERGHDADAILRHYYRGARIESVY